MRAAGPDDLPALQDIADRSRDAAGLPRDVSIRPLAATAWEDDSRLVPGAGWVAVRVARTVRDGNWVITNLFGLDEQIRVSLLRWAVGRAHQLGADGIGLWVDRGHGDWLRGHGFEPTRPFLRMDRENLEAIPTTVFPDGYRVVDGRDPALAISTWVDTLNVSFADHWRHAPEDPLLPPASLTDADRRLHLMALAPGGAPAAVVISNLIATGDVRRQPIGYIQQVGTVPAHRRKGLGRSLTAAALRVLRDAGAASASLNVDAKNAARAYDLYRSLGFDVTREYDVWCLELTARSEL